MNIAFDPITHVVRANVFETAVTWTLGPDSLEREDRPGMVARLPYAEIAELRLSFAPSRFDSARYRCDVNWPRAFAPGAIPPEALPRG
jgi:hypothetical protein